MGATQSNNANAIANTDDTQSETNDEKSTSDELTTPTVDPALLIDYRRTTLKLFKDCIDIFVDVFNQKEELDMTEFDHVFGLFLGDSVPHFELFCNNTGRVNSHQAFCACILMSSESLETKTHLVFKVFSKDPTGLILELPCVQLLNIFQSSCIGIAKILGKIIPPDGKLQMMAKEATILCATQGDDTVMGEEEFIQWLSTNRDSTAYLNQVSQAMNDIAFYDVNISALYMAGELFNEEEDESSETEHNEYTQDITNHPSQSIENTDQNARKKTKSSATQPFHNHRFYDDTISKLANKRWCEALPMAQSNETVFGALSRLFFSTHRISKWYNIQVALISRPEMGCGNPTNVYDSVDLPFLLGRLLAEPLARIQELELLNVNTNKTAHNFKTSDTNRGTESVRMDTRVLQNAPRKPKLYKENDEQKFPEESENRNTKEVTPNTTVRLKSVPVSTEQSVFSLLDILSDPKSSCCAVHACDSENLNPAWDDDPLTLITKLDVIRYIAEDASMIGPAHETSLYWLGYPRMKSIHCTPDQPLYMALAMLLDRRCSTVPVLDAHMRFVGEITNTYVAKSLIKECERVRDERHVDSEVNVDAWLTQLVGEWLKENKMEFKGTLDRACVCTYQARLGDVCVEMTRCLSERCYVINKKRQVVSVVTASDVLLLLLHAASSPPKQSLRNVLLEMQFALNPTASLKKLLRKRSVSNMVGH